MAGLVAYGSSDDEDEPQDVHRPDELSAREAEKGALESQTESKANGLHINANSNTAHEEAPATEVHDEALRLEPSIGPTMPSDADMASPLPGGDEQSSPQSPYSANRSLLRELTLPLIPNLDIPPSPPRSPPPTTNAKFAHFRKLKKQGVHFNEKLAKSSALKNPSLMQKQMNFADIGEENEYATTLPDDLWNPKGFPEWAFKEELAKSQQLVLKQREVEKKGRDTVDFVSATSSSESNGNGTSAMGATSRIAPMSAAERVMAGLERDRSNPSQVHAGMKRKTRFES